MREKATVTVTALGPLIDYPTTALHKFESCIYSYGRRLGISHAVVELQAKTSKDNMHNYVQMCHYYTL